MTRIALGFLQLLAYLPLRVLYPIGGGVAWILRRVIGYRLKVIQDNLTRSFPQRSEQEISALAKRYYTFLGELIVENIKLLQISKPDLLNRCQFENPEVLAQYESNGKNVIIMMGHSGNWEWAGAATAICFNFTMLPVYRRVKHPDMNRFFINLRSRFNAIPVLDQEAFSVIRNAPQPHAVAMLADQTPGSRKGWWTNFLNQKTPFYRGSEILARRLGYDVVFAHVQRKKRGQYSVKLQQFEGNISEQYALTKGFALFLESQINKEPENWLWSHKRWKHQQTASSTWMD